MNAARFVGLFLCMGLHLKAFSLVSLNPLELLSVKRFDILAKYIYAKHFINGVKSNWALELYSHHLKVLNNFQEHPQPETIAHGSCTNYYPDKSTLDDFTREFQKVIKSIKDEGFNQQKSVLPIDSNNQLFDGAHRVAASLALNKEVVCKRFSHLSKHSFTARELQSKNNYVKQGFEQEYLDALALEYTQLKKDLFLIIYTQDSISDTQIESCLAKTSSVVYTKSFNLTKNGAINFFRLFKAGQDLNSLKQLSVEKSTQQFRLLLIEGDSGVAQQLLEQQNYNAKIVYVTQTHSEAVELAQMVFNENSLQFLNNAKSTWWEKFEQTLMRIKERIIQENIDPDSICIDGDLVMAAYGIRDTEKIELSQHHQAVDNKHHFVGIDDIIFNPRYHFYYKGLKFASLEVVKGMKVNRADKQDIRDLESITNHEIELLPFDAHGWFALTNKAYLMKFIKQLQPKVIIEVGTWLGASCLFMAQNSSSKTKVYAIDNWNLAGSEGVQENPVSRSKLAKLYPQFLSNVIQKKMVHKVIPLKMDSHKAASSMIVKADLIYIDACHEEEFVYADIMNWYAHLNKGGIMCGDDWSYRGVKRAVTRASNKLGCSYHGDNGFWYFSPKE